MSWNIYKVITPLITTSEDFEDGTPTTGWLWQGIQRDCSQGADGTSCNLGIGDPGGIPYTKYESDDNVFWGTWWGHPSTGGQKGHGIDEISFGVTTNTRTIIWYVKYDSDGVSIHKETEAWVWVSTHDFYGAASGYPVEGDFSNSEPFISLGFAVSNGHVFYRATLYITDAVGDSYLSIDGAAYNIGNFEPTTWTKMSLIITNNTIKLTKNDVQIADWNVPPGATATFNALFPQDTTNIISDISKLWFTQPKENVGHGYMIIADQDVDFSDYYDLQEQEIIILDKDDNRRFVGEITKPTTVTDGVRLDFREITYQLIQRTCKREGVSEKGTIDVMVEE